MSGMLTRRRIIAAGVIVSLHFLSFSSLAAAETWTWFRSASEGKEWWITKGQGDVDFSGGAFRATLRDGEDGSVRLSLRGTFSNGSVRARATVAETDNPPFAVSGRLRRFCWPTGGREILILTDRAEAIGLFRELAPSKACKPAP
jgi:hypothetical protein